MTRKISILACLALFFLCNMAASLGAQVPGFTAPEVQTLGDLNFIARAKLGHTGPEKERLYALALALKNGSVSSWKAQDSDPGQILGFMADTDDGKYPPNRALVDRLASFLSISVKAVVWPPAATTPPPGPIVVVPPPAPAPTTPGTVDAAIQALIEAKLAGLQAQVSGLATRLAAAESRPASSGGAGGALAGLSTPQPGYLEFRSAAAPQNQFGLPPTEFYTVCNSNGWDAAYRCHQNWEYRGSRKLPIAIDGFDSRGSWSYNWSPAAEPLNGVQESPDMALSTAAQGSPLWKAYRGQTLVIDAGAQAAYDYTTGEQLYSSRNVLIAAQRAGWSMYFAVSPERTSSDTPTNRAVMKLEASPAWNPNPVWLTISGSLRRVKPCTEGATSGPLCF